LKRRREIYLRCPECKAKLKVSFPESFYFNEAAVKCECGFKAYSAEMSPGEALEALTEKLEKIRKQ
jgi:hypothetical protein